LYVTDRNNHAVRKITSTGVTTTLAGSGSAGYSNGTGTAAKFTFPSGITVTSAGTVYVADTDNQVIRKITPAGVVTTAAGNGVGSADGVGTAATFWNPKDVAADANGNLFVTDKSNYLIRKGSEQMTQADCLFNWAESNYPTLFSPPAKSLSSAPYYFRYFSNNPRGYLGTSEADGRLYYLGPDGVLINVGTQAYWFGVAGCLN